MWNGNFNTDVYSFQIDRTSIVAQAYYNFFMLVVILLLHKMLRGQHGSLLSGPNLRTTCNDPVGTQLIKASCTTSDFEGLVI